MNVESIEKATVKDLDSFGNWLRKERVVKKFFNAYCRYVSQYFLFIEKIDLAKIAQKGFESKEMKED